MRLELRFMPGMTAVRCVLAVAICCASGGIAAQHCDTNLGIAFVENGRHDGINFQHRAHHSSMSYPLEVMGSGVALFDFDNDGRLDIFLVNGASFPDPNPAAEAPRKAGPQDWNRLYRQKADGTFEDVTAKAGLAGEGYGMGAAVADYDNDGNEDVFVTGFPQSHLYHNNGDGTFTDVTSQAGIAAPGWTTSAVWVDLDGDGLLDLVVLRYLNWNFDRKYCPTPDGKQSYCDPKTFPAIAPLVYHNEGRGRFTEVSEKSGILKPGKGLGVAIGDYDGDGKIDIAVANDGMEQYLYRNKGNGTFEESGLSANIATDGNGRTYAGMGVVFDDLNNDGMSDIAIDDLALQSFALYRNRGDGTFDYASASMGFTRATMAHSGWGLQAIDADNNGWKDLMVARGHVNVDIRKDNPQLSYLEAPALLRNTGHGFEDVSGCLGEIAALPFAGRGLATGDLDNDGRVDAVMTGNDGRAFVLRNKSANPNGAPHHWLSFQLVGKASNRDGIGAEIRITTAKGLQAATVSTGGSYASSSDKRVHFGLGTQETVLQVEIHWPSGVKDTIHPAEVDRFYTVTEGLGITGIGCGDKPCLATGKQTLHLN
jgi:hypothetical protein